MKVRERHGGTHGKHRDEKQMLYIVDTYGNMILALIEKHLFTLPDQQENCIYSVLLAIWENLDCFDSSQATLQSWIGAVTRYQCLNYLKKYQENMEASLPWKTKEETVKEEKMMTWLIEREIDEEEELMLSCLAPEEGKALLAGGPLVYTILNRVETDFYEYETKRNLPQELAMMKKNLRKKIREQQGGTYVREGLWSFLKMKHALETSVY